MGAIHKHRKTTNVATKWEIYSWYLHFLTWPNYYEGETVKNENAILRYSRDIMLTDRRPHTHRHLGKYYFPHCHSP